MAKRSRGTHSKGTKRFKRKKRITLNEKMKTFEIGEKVMLKIAPEMSTAPHRRYHGRCGTIVEKRGCAYVVEIKDGKKTKKILTTPVHIQPQPSAGNGQKSEA